MLFMRSSQVSGRNGAEPIPRETESFSLSGGEGRALRDMSRSRRRHGTRARSPSTSAAAMQIAVDGTKRPPLREEDPSGKYFRAERRRGASPARHEPQSKRERRRAADPARHEPQSKRERSRRARDDIEARHGTRARSPSTSAAAMQSAVDGTKRPPLREEGPSGEYSRGYTQRVTVRECPRPCPSSLPCMTPSPLTSTMAT